MCLKVCFTLVLSVAGLVSLLVWQHGSIEEVSYHYFPLIPIVYFQAFAVYFLWLGTCVYREPSPLTCRSADSEGDLWVAVATAKGGTVLTARTAVDVGRACGLCVGIGHRPDSEWPPAQEYTPDYKCDVLLALANMQQWRSYAKARGGRVRCIVITRHPFARFKSLYQYTFNGQEYSLTPIMHELREKHSKNKTDAVDYLFRKIGEKTLLDAHYHIQTSLLHPGCIQIRLEDFEEDFDSAMTRWITHWGINDVQLQQKLITLVNKHNLKKKSERELEKEHHTSSRSFNASVRETVVKAIRENHQIMFLIQQQARELGYDPIL